MWASSMWAGVWSHAAPMLQSSFTTCPTMESYGFQTDFNFKRVLTVKPITGLQNKYSRTHRWHHTRTEKAQRQTAIHAHIIRKFEISISNMGHSWRTWRTLKSTGRTCKNNKGLGPEDQTHKILALSPYIIGVKLWPVAQILSTVPFHLACKAKQNHCKNHLATVIQHNTITENPRIFCW